MGGHLLRAEGFVSASLVHVCPHHRACTSFPKSVIPSLISSPTSDSVTGLPDSPDIEGSFAPILQMSKWKPRLADNMCTCTGQKPHPLLSFPWLP